MYEIDANGCFVFTGRYRSRDGYAMVQLPREPGQRKGRRRFAHRVLYEIVVGNVAPGLVLDHLCRNRLCLNPDHLEEVTPLENTRRGARATAVTCLHGHDLNEVTTYVSSQGWRGCRKCRAAARRRHAERVAVAA